VRTQKPLTTLSALDMCRPAPTTSAAFATGDERPDGDQDRGDTAKDGGDDMGNGHDERVERLRGVSDCAWPRGRCGDSLRR
jgi:hypothetical protein